MAYIRFFTIFYLLLNLLPFSSFAQVGVFNRIGTEQGLAPGNVNDIIQDSIGFIWIGTESGLCRYDGYNFITYKNEVEDTTSLSYNNIFSLLLDADGIIWVGTLGGGLNKFDSKTGKFRRYNNEKDNENSISSDIIFKVYKDSKKRLWISTLGGGLNLFDPKTEKFTVYKHVTSDEATISSNMVSSIFEDKKNNLWIGTFDAGLNLFNEEEQTFTHFRKNTSKQFSINHDQVMDIIEYSENSLLIATFGGGINELNTERMTFTNFENDNSFNFETEHRNIRKLYDDGKNIWIASYNGLYKFQKNTETIEKYIYDHENVFSINNNKIREIFKDDTGLIWIGTIYGANIYDPNRKKFEFISYSSFAENMVKEAYTVPDYKKNTNILWASNRINNSSKNRRIKYYGNPNIDNQYKSKYSINFYWDEQSILWIGDYNGLKYFDDNANEFKYVEYFSLGENELGNNFIKSFYFDSSGDLWAGTHGGGLTVLDNSKGNYKRYVHNEYDTLSIGDSRVIPIYEDNIGELWIGTYGGLNKFNKEDESFKRYKYVPSDPSSISNDRIYSIYESSSNELWIGTYQGLNKYIRSQDNFEHVTIEDGLADNTVYGILEDDENNLWIRTNEGISKYNPRTKLIKNYNRDDGLEGLSSNSSICFKDKNGKLFFSGLNGFNAFYPDEIKNENVTPQIVFTELRVLDEIIGIGNSTYLPESLNDLDELELSYIDKVFSIEFASLHYAIPAKNNYAYMLEGFRDQWTFVDSKNRMATFTNLNAGEYTLHVKATNNDGFWNETGRSLKIVITPPYWETWWFRTAAFIGLLLIIFAIYEFRLQRLLEIERTRARIARNLHDDVGGTLASIQYFVDAIRKNNGERHKNKFLDLIMASSNDAQEKIRDIIWTVNPKEDGLSRFLVKFNRHASDLFDSHDIKYKIHFPKGELEKNIGMEKRQHIWCICKETITNIIKHSQCANVDVSFNLEGNELQYTIKDDGIGFDEVNTSPGDGLTNIAFRADKLGAKYLIESAENKGMKFQIKFTI